MKAYDYRALIGELKAAGAKCEEAKAALEEAADIIYDYERAAKQAAEMAEKYEMPKRVIRRGYGGMGAWQCPDCQAFVDVDSAHCRRCGRMLEWTFQKRKKKKGKKR